MYSIEEIFNTFMTYTHVVLIISIVILTILVGAYRWKIASKKRLLIFMSIGYVLLALSISIEIATLIKSDDAFYLCIAGFVITYTILKPTLFRNVSI